MKKNITLILLLISAQIYSQTYIYTAYVGVTSSPDKYFKAMCLTIPQATAQYTYGNGTIGYWYYKRYWSTAYWASDQAAISGLNNYHLATTSELNTLLSYVNTGITPGANIINLNTRTLLDHIMFFGTNSAGNPIDGSITVKSSGVNFSGSPYTFTKILASQASTRTVYRSTNPSIDYPASTSTNLYVSTSLPNVPYEKFGDLYWTASWWNISLASLATSANWDTIFQSLTWIPSSAFLSHAPFNGLANVWLNNTTIFSSNPGIFYKPSDSGYYYSFSNSTAILASEQFSETPFSVYPNPISSMLNIDSDKEFFASLYDLTGKKLLNFSTKTFDISQLASGIYYLDIILEDKRYTKKIIKQ